MAQANVYTSVSAQAWYTDKARIATSTTPVSYNVNLIYPSGAGNIFNAESQIPANSSMDVYVGVGNQLTVTGANFTVQEVGTTSSGILAVGRA